MSSSSKLQKYLIPLAFFSIYVIWGTTFLAISYGLKGFPPFILSGFRFVVAGIIFLVLLYAKGERANSLSSWKQNAISGTLILTIGAGAVAWAEQYITSTEAAIVAASEPFWFILLDRRNWKYYFSNKLAIAGLVIGFIGLLLFFNNSLSGAHIVEAGESSFRGIAFIVLIFSALAWVIGSLYSKKEQKTKTSIFMNVAQQLTMGGITSLIFASLRGEWQVMQWSSIPWDAWAGLLYLIFFGSIMAYLSFIWLLSVRPPALVSTHTFVNPIVAVIAGSLIAHEVISSGQLIGLSIILIGVILTNIVQYKLPKRTKVRIRKARQMMRKLTKTRRKRPPKY